MTRTPYKEPSKYQALTDEEYEKEFECQRRYRNEPIYDLKPVKKSSVYPVSSRLSTSGLIKHYNGWLEVLDKRHWVKGHTYSQRYPTGSSIIIANLNIRKIEMLLAVRGAYTPVIADEFKQIGRIQFSMNARHYILKRFNYRCVDCGATNMQTRLHIDHIKPISKGGTNELDNLQVLCQKCNLSKHTDEWIGGA